MQHYIPEFCCWQIEDRSAPVSYTHLLPVESPEEELADSISLRQVLALLEEKDQMLIRLRYFKGKTQVETAAVLGMTQVQVSRREKKILLHLRELLL